MTIELNLVAPDISAYAKGNTGLDYVTTFDSGVPGPHVMVNALTHGNELCGAITLDALFRLDLRPTRGKLTFGFANISAYLRFDPTRPAASRFVDEDFNRLWSNDVLDSPRRSLELTRARAYRPLIDTVDFLLDLHSMQQASPALMLSGPLAKGRALARLHPSAPRSRRRQLGRVRPAAAPIGERCAAALEAPEQLAVPL